MQRPNSTAQAGSAASPPLSRDKEQLKAVIAHLATEGLALRENIKQSIKVAGPGVSPHAIGLVPPPRISYSCRLDAAGVPGASCLDAQMHKVPFDWEALKRHIRVEVSGTSEGSAEAILSDAGFFATDDNVGAHITLHFPCPVLLTEFSFEHGHRRDGFWQMFNW